MLIVKGPQGRWKIRDGKRLSSQWGHSNTSSNPARILMSFIDHTHRLATVPKEVLHRQIESERCTTSKIAMSQEWISWLLVLQKGQMASLQRELLDLQQTCRWSNRKSSNRGMCQLIQSRCRPDKSQGMYPPYKRFQRTSERSREEAATEEGVTRLLTLTCNKVEQSKVFRSSLEWTRLVPSRTPWL